MSTSNTHRVTLSADALERWKTDKRTRDRILFTARYNAKQLGQTRIEILDEARNILRTVEPPKPAPESARMPFVRHDGGRAASGFKGTASGDCVTRAIATATGKPYREVYDALNALAKRERPRGKTRRSSAANGVHRVTYERYLFGLGFKFVPTMGIGTGTKVHVRADELPEGRLVLSLSRHLAAVVDGEVYDLDDCSRWGTRCVYGYYLAPASMRIKNCRKCEAVGGPGAVVDGCDWCGGCGDQPNDPADLLCTCLTDPNTCPVDTENKAAA